MQEIRNIIEAYNNIDWDTEKVALASVVNVEESSYRRIGARMLVRSNGQWVGGISGGCLEGDALKRSQIAIFKDKPSRVIYDTMEDDQNQIGVGLGCNGRIEVLFTPIHPSDKANEIEILKSIVHKDHPSMILKIINSPSDESLLGALKLNKSKAGNLLTGIPEIEIQRCIDQVINSEKSKTFDLRNENSHTFKLLIEFIRPEIHLIIVGDNYDILSMLGIANELGWRCTVVGRKKKLSKRVYQLTESVVEYEEADSLIVNDYTAIVLMSHDYNWDKIMIPIFTAKNPRYIGMLGPKKRMNKMQSDLDAINLENLKYFYSPTGLEIGAESPAEIALSIAAEIVATFRNKSGQSLKLKDGTIHDRH